MNRDESNESTPRRIVRAEEIGRLVYTKRIDEGLNLAESAKRSGVSAATLSRLERMARGEGGPFPTPDTKTLTALCQWLGVTLELEDGAGTAATEDTELPDVVDTYLRADRKLKPADALMLSKLFRAAYDQFSRTEDS